MLMMLIVGVFVGVIVDVIWWDTGSGLGALVGGLVYQSQGAVWLFKACAVLSLFSTGIAATAYFSLKPPAATLPLSFTRVTCHDLDQDLELHLALNLDEDVNSSIHENIDVNIDLGDNSGDGDRIKKDVDDDEEEEVDVDLHTAASFFVSSSNNNMRSSAGSASNLSAVAAAASAAAAAVVDGFKFGDKGSSNDIEMVDVEIGK